MKLFTTKRLCRAGIIAAAYVALTLAFAPVAYGPIQVRPAEAFAILPLFFIESVPALFVGCMLANIFSQFGLIDIIGGSTITLLAAILTYLVGQVIKHNVLKVVIGGIFPIALNAVLLPVMFAIIGGMGAFVINLFSILVTEILFVYGLGIPLFFTVTKLQKKSDLFLS